MGFFQGWWLDHFYFSNSENEKKNHMLIGEFRSLPDIESTIFSGHTLVTIYVF